MENVNDVAAAPTVEMKSIKLPKLKKMSKKTAKVLGGVVIGTGALVLTIMLGRDRVDLINNLPQVEAEDQE